MFTKYLILIISPIHIAKLTLLIKKTTFVAFVLSSINVIIPLINHYINFLFALDFIGKFKESILLQECNFPNQFSSIFIRNHFLNIYFSIRYFQIYYHK